MKLSDAQTLVDTLMAQHLDLAWWSFRFDNAKRRFGQCRHRRGIIGGRITLSRVLVELNDEPEVRDTVLHEIAHALTPGACHGWAWKQACILVGARPIRCYLSTEITAPACRYLLFHKHYPKRMWERHRIAPQIKQQVTVSNMQIYDQRGREWMTAANHRGETVEPWKWAVAKANSLNDLEGA